MSRGRAEPARRRPAASGREAAPARPIPLLEWLVGGLGALLVAGSIAYLVYHALWRDAAPPDVQVAVEAIVPRADGWLVQFRAINRGGRAAAELVVEGELVSGEGPIETGEATLDYLPPRSERTGGLFFTRDPRGFELQLRAKGYAEP